MNLFDLNQPCNFSAFTQFLHKSVHFSNTKAKLFAHIFNRDRRFFGQNHKQVIYAIIYAIICAIIYATMNACYGKWKYYLNKMIRNMENILSYTLRIRLIPRAKLLYKAYIFKHAHKFTVSFGILLQLKKSSILCPGIKPP